MHSTPCGRSAGRRIQRGAPWQGVSFTMKIFIKLDYLLVIIALLIFVGHFTHGFNIVLPIFVLSIWNIFRLFVGPKHIKLSTEELLKAAYLEAGKHLINPMHVHEYMDKKGITYKQVKVLINAGEISAWGGTAEESVFIDDEN